MLYRSPPCGAVLKLSREVGPHHPHSDRFLWGTATADAGRTPAVAWCAPVSAQNPRDPRRSGILTVMEAAEDTRSTDHGAVETWLRHTRHLADPGVARRVFRIANPTNSRIEIAAFADPRRLTLTPKTRYPITYRGLGECSARYWRASTPQLLPHFTIAALADFDDVTPLLFSQFFPALDQVWNDSYQIMLGARQALQQGDEDTALQHFHDMTPAGLLAFALSPLLYGKEAAQRYLADHGYEMFLTINPCVSSSVAPSPSYVKDRDPDDPSWMSKTTLPFQWMWEWAVAAAKAFGYNPPQWLRTRIDKDWRTWLYLPAHLLPPQHFPHHRLAPQWVDKVDHLLDDPATRDLFLDTLETDPAAHPLHIVTTPTLLHAQFSPL